MFKVRHLSVVLIAFMTLVSACSKPAAPPAAKSEGAANSAATAAESAAASPTPSVPVMPIEEMIKPWTGDFDGMGERRLIRALVVHSRMFYFLDGPQQRGVSYEVMKQFESFVNDRLKTGTLKVQVAFIPVPREHLIPSLISGRGDIIAANLTATEARKESVQFSDPLLSGISELIVTAPGAPELKSLDDLAGKEAWVRASSSYYESLHRLNQQFKHDGKGEIKIKPADELLEDDGILEMVNADLIPITVVDSHKAKFWAQVFDKIKVHPELAVNTGGNIAWAFRKDSPKLAEVVNAFIKENKQGTMFGNMMLKRWLSSADYVKNSTSKEDLEKFNAMTSLFKKYASQYDFDWLMVGAQAYQESRLDQSLRSPVGAVGVMQIKPDTAADPNVSIPNIEQVENNIHAGIKYLRFVEDQYFKDAKMNRTNKMLFAFASYNAGPAKVASLRRKAEAQGLDPNKWFYNVEVIAAREIGRETVQYVGNIYKYYIAYKQIQAINQKKAKKA